MERLENNLGKKFERVIADAGYESEENYTYFESKDEQTCFIKPTNYERSKTRKFKSNMNLRENMPYDALGQSQQGWREGEADTVPFIKYILGTILAAYSVLPIITHLS